MQSFFRSTNSLSVSLVYFSDSMGRRGILYGYEKTAEEENIVPFQRFINKK